LLVVLLGLAIFVLVVCFVILPWMHRQEIEARRRESEARRRR
jgi:hypothetical protein